MMYGDLHLVVPVAFHKWSDIRDVDYQVAENCVHNHVQGGAAEVFGIS